MTANPTESDRGRQLLPALVKHPLTLLIAVAVPQVILLLINLNAYYLISGEINDKQQFKAIGILWGELFVMLTGLGLALFFFLKKRPSIPWGYYWLILIPHCIYLVFFTTTSYQVIPDSLQVWIVPPQSLISSQFVGIMPATFLAALCLACFPTRLPVAKDIGFSAGLTFAIPALWYVVMHSRRMFSGGAIANQIMTILFVISALVCLTGIIRVLTMAFNAIQRKGPVGQAVFVFIVAVAGPIGGLLLNRSIGFPADFQSVYIYLLAIGNGLVLMIPKLDNEKWNRAAWLAQCLFFPFTLYFFTVFLPYLPLAIVAILAMGSGFLILVPSLLFIVHLRKLAEGATHRKAVLAGILMTLVVPAYLFVEAHLDRRAIHQSIDYVYSPDFEHGDRFEGSRYAVKRSLLRLDRIKKGRYLPFLTQIYNYIVLDNLVLSDSKMKEIYLSFFGEEMPPVQFEGSGLWGRSDREQRNSRLSAPPPKSAELIKVESTESVEQGMVKTLVKLELHNPKRFVSEFATTIEIPEGMFVSGYWLQIGNERVPGKIFEKKTAMWVYRMIRDATRRDPGLLTYENPHQLSLRVFPFAENETRITEIEFLSPAGFTNTITIGEKTIQGSAVTDPRIVNCKIDESSSSIHLNETAIRSLPSVSRIPYLHFIVDRSITGLSDEEIAKETKRVTTKFPEIKECAITFANYEIQDRDGGNLKPVDQLELKPELPLRGGFMMSRVLMRSLARYDRNQSLKCPLFVILAGSGTNPELKESLAWLTEALPDFEGFYIQVAGQPAKAVRFDGGEIGGHLEQRSVHLLKSGEVQDAFADSTGAGSVTVSRNGELQVYDSESSLFRPVNITDTIADTSLYSQAVAGWSLNSRTVRNPALINELLPQIVGKSRESGILLPDTAYIVVENSAQWKILLQKEKKKLKGNQALDHMETPEPYWWLFLVAYLVVAMIRHRQRIRRSASPETEIQGVGNGMRH